MNDEFQNALAWFTSAPAAWIESGRKNLAAGAEWVWVVIQGDFSEEASTSQVAVGTVISMIPFVDQICDVRDVVANCKKIKEEPDKHSHWVSLVLTLIGLFPSLGSLLKGCFKVAFASMRKAGAASGATPRIALLIDQGIAELNRFLARPEVAKSLAALKWDNPYKILSKHLKSLAAKLNVNALLEAFNQATQAVESLLNLVKRWGSSGLVEKANAVLKLIDEVRRIADRKIAQAISPVQDILQQLARRLDIEADMSHRAYLNTVNPHAYSKISEAEAIAEFKKAKPGWVSDTGKTPYEQLENAPDPLPGYPSVKDFETFHTMRPKIYSPGTKLYRVVDPTSKDNSICWMTEEEFRKLKSKDDWRRRFAVWAHWNGNGEFITYTVPPGEGLKVWEGITASQRLGKTDYVLEGGARQIVVDPSHLDKAYVSRRKKTNWGYEDLNRKQELLGVPVQMNNWAE